MTAIPASHFGTEIPAPKMPPSAKEYTWGVWGRIGAQYRLHPEKFQAGGEYAPEGPLGKMWAKHGAAIMAANTREVVIANYGNDLAFDEQAMARLKAGTTARSTTTAIVDRLNNALDRTKSALGIGATKAAATPPAASTARSVAIPAPVAAAADVLAGLSGQDRAEIAAWEREFSTLKSDAQRDSYVEKLASQMKATMTKPASPPAPPAKPTMTVSAWQALKPQDQYKFIMVTKGKLIDAPPPVASRQEDLPKGTLNRASFDKLSQKEKNDHFRNGGHLVD